MASKSGGKLEKWRDYFRRASSDIFDIIEHAIMVAATDCPQEFRVRRERITELLFTCRVTRCLGCDRVELAVNNGEVKGVSVDDDEDDDHMGGGGGGSKGSKVNSITRDNDYDDDDDDHMVVNNDDDGDDDLDGDINGDEIINVINHENNFSYGDAEALTDEIEEAKGVVDEVYRIKDILNNSQDESDSVLFESLRRLQLMALNYDILKTTEIGKVVNRIRKHSSKQIRHLARALIDGWKVIVDEWVKATQDLAGGDTPDSVNPSTVDDEEGLPSPPLDEGAFMTTQTMDFSQFFDGMDDDGNPRNCGEINKNLQVREAGRKSTLAKQDPSKRREEYPKQAIPRLKDTKVQQSRRQEPLSKPNKPLNTQSGPGRPLKPNGEPKLVKDSGFQQKSGKPSDHKKPPSQPERVRSSSDNAVQDKLEATKRKLQERYQQAENAKRQRTIQVMDIQDIPKQGLTKPNPFNKFGNNRSWANGRR